MSRFSAFAVHLGISFLIFLGLTYLVVFEWYPDLFFETDGGWRGMRIIIAVDMVLGPLLTLIVFKAGKPGLRTDLTLIGIFQFICLSAGTYVVYSERPITVVYEDGRFTVMTTDDYQAEGGLGVPDLRHFPGDDPKWVMVNLPDDENEQHSIRREAYQSGRSITTLSQFYEPLATQSEEFFADAEDLQIIISDDVWAQRLDNWLADQGGNLDDYAFFTFGSRYAFGYLIYDRASRTRVGLVTSLDN